MCGNNDDGHYFTFNDNSLLLVFALMIFCGRHCFRNWNEMINFGHTALNIVNKFEKAPYQHI